MHTACAPPLRCITPWLLLGGKPFGCLQPKTLHLRVPGAPCTPPGSFISPERALQRAGQPRIWASCAPCLAAPLKGMINEHLRPQSSRGKSALQTNVKGGSLKFPFDLGFQARISKPGPSGGLCPAWVPPASTLLSSLAPGARGGVPGRHHTCPPGTYPRF